jgi:hypothetical protein
MKRAIALRICAQTVRLSWIRPLPATVGCRHRASYDNPVSSPQDELFAH